MLNYITTDLSDKNSTIQDLVNSIQGNLLYNGRLLKDVSVVSSTDNVINHGLSRVPNGYIIVSKSATCDLVFVRSDSLTITLNPTANATISLWVF